jgi:hypothetical protein
MIELFTYSPTTVRIIVVLRKLSRITRGGGGKPRIQDGMMNQVHHHIPVIEPVLGIAIPSPSVPLGKKLGGPENEVPSHLRYERLTYR